MKTESKPKSVRKERGGERRTNAKEASNEKEKVIVKEESDPDLKADPGKLENPREPNVVFGKWLDYSTEQMQSFQK